MESLTKESYVTLPRKSTKAKNRSKKASGTGEMTAESFVSLFNHSGVSKCVFKVVWCGLVGWVYFTDRDGLDWTHTKYRVVQKMADSV